MLVRLFQYAVHPGMEQAYRDYLRDVVEAIDRAAHAQGVFEAVFTILPEQAADWTQGRLFTFRDAAQRAAMAERMAAAALAFDGSAGATARRKQYAETLRRLVAVQDYRLSPPGAE